MERIEWQPDPAFPLREIELAESFSEVWGETVPDGRSAEPRDAAFPARAAPVRIDYAARMRVTATALGLELFLGPLADPHGLSAPGVLDLPRVGHPL